MKSGITLNLVKSLKVSLLIYLASPLLVSAQIISGLSEWPMKTVRIVVPFAPGGGTDYVARLTAQRLTEHLGQTFIIENKPGAGGITGTDLIAKSKADGYNFVIVSGSHTINPNLYKILPYDTQRDFLPVSNLVMGPAILVVNPSLKVNSLKDLIALSKS
jgi:tripartite-type tricarboxylate transporter receptor subunit TctC